MCVYVCVCVNVKLSKFQRDSEYNQEFATLRSYNYYLCMYVYVYEYMYVCIYVNV